MPDMNAREPFCMNPSQLIWTLMRGPVKQVLPIKGGPRNRTFSAMDSAILASDYLALRALQCMWPHLLVVVVRCSAGGTA